MTKLKKIICGNIPEILILSVCLMIFVYYAGEKEGYHMDELLSFELSNAEFTPWIVPTQPEGRLEKFVKNELRDDKGNLVFGRLTEALSDVLQNRKASKLLSYRADVYDEPVWIGSDEFKDYITVGDGDAFNYLSVYFNVKDDNHPPLHFMLLHTVSSVFKGRVRPWMGCVINISAVMIIMICLFRTGRLICSGAAGRETGMLSALMYGLGAGAISSVLLNRMYGLLTMWCMLTLYLHIRRYREGFNGKELILTAVTVLGFLTQYFFLFYCISLAVTMTVILLMEKRTAELLVYIRTMLISAAAGLILFPFAISDVFTSGRGVEALGNLSEGLTGYGERLKGFLELMIWRNMGPAPLIAACFGMILCVLRLARRKDMYGKGALVMLTVIPVAVYFAFVSRMAPYIVDRYVMPIFPVMALLSAGSIEFIKKELEFHKDRFMRVMTYVISGIAVLGAFLCGCRGGGEYLYKGYAYQEAMSKELSYLPCLCIYEGYGYYENLIEFTNYKETLLLRTKELSGRKVLTDITDKDEMAVLIKQNADAEKVDGILRDRYCFVQSSEYLLAESVYGVRLYIYRIADTNETDK